MRLLVSSLAFLAWLLGALFRRRCPGCVFKFAQGLRVNAWDLACLVKGGLGQRTGTRIGLLVARCCSNYRCFHHVAHHLSRIYPPTKSHTWQVSFRFVLLKSALQFNCPLLWTCSQTQTASLLWTLGQTRQVPVRFAPCPLKFSDRKRPPLGLATSQRSRPSV